MSYVLDGITIDGGRLDASPAAGTAAGAASALAMAVTWCGVSHLTRGDASLPVRAIAATLLGPPRDADPRRTAIAIALGLLIHFAIGMILGHAIERATRELAPRRLPRGAFVLLASVLGLGLSAGVLERLAPAFVEAVPRPAFLAGHLLLGIALELAGHFRDHARGATGDAARLAKS